MLNTAALIMLLFGASILYGGLAYFLYKALKTKKEYND
jgi:hypothetical protein